MPCEAVALQAVRQGRSSGAWAAAVAVRVVAPVLVSLAAGAAITLLLELAEAHLGWPSHVRFIVVIVLMLFAASSSSAHEAIFEREVLRGHDAAGSRRYTASHASNLAIGARLTIVGLTVFGLSLVF